LNFDEEWIKEVRIEDVPRAFREIVEVIGIEAAARLSQRFGGIPLYVPKIEALLERKRNEMICRDVRIVGYRQTALKYKLSEVWVRQIADHKSEDKQESLFSND
jgi:Mor family transcriptional regulator